MTGLDLWIEKNGRREDDTLGLARTRGMCHSKFSCAVGQCSQLPLTLTALSIILFS